MDKLLIGIDPGTTKSGFAVYSPEHKTIISLSCYMMFELFVKLNEMNCSHEIFVYLEDPALDRRTWHGGGKGSARDVGMNQGVSRQIQIFMDAHHIPYMLLRPNGYSQWTHERFCKVTGWDKGKPTNKDNRAAGIMVFGRTK